MKQFYQWMQQQSKNENSVYIVLWSLLFAASLLGLYLRTWHNSNLTFDWQEVWMIWSSFALYLLLFLLHNFLLAPILIYGRKLWLYLTLTCCLLGAFTLYQCNSRPDDMRHEPHAMNLRHDKRHNERHDLQHDEQYDKQPPLMDKQPPLMDDHRPPEFDRRHHDRHRPPLLLAERDIVSVVVLILMFGMNIGIKLYFRTRRDEKKMVELEKQNLEQQLEYLKYQINPHFFMNTLNNIHALVDIDPQKAQTTIRELSKMMRFVLYEGDKKGVPLTREFEFIRTYLSLMRLRYTDKVTIQADLPQEAPDATIPPLMLISFIENAFKHGISYQHDSFVSIKADIRQERLHFLCRNSKAEKSNQEKGGVGLANVKQRLNLLYDDNYTLNIQDEADIYCVELDIPLS